MPPEEGGQRESKECVSVGIPGPSRSWPFHPRPYLVYPGRWGWTQPTEGHRICEVSTSAARTWISQEGSRPGGPTKMSFALRPVSLRVGEEAQLAKSTISLISAEWKCLMEIKCNRGEIKQVLLHVHLSLWCRFVPHSGK